ncbi:MAG: MATE family efflux transporter [Bacteroidia bacterium]
MTYTTHFQKTIQLAIPVIVGLLGQMLMGAIDTFMIGKLGHEYVSAAGLGNSMFYLVAVLGFGLTSVLASLIAESSATDDTKICRDYLQQGVYVGMLVGLVTVCLLLLCAHYLPLLRQPKMDTMLARGFLEIFGLSAVPMLIFLVFKQFTDGLGNTRAAAIITLIGLITNIFFNYLLIEGNWGFPRMEVRGTALASFISRILMMILMIMYVFQHKPYQKYQLKENWGKWKGEIAGKIAKLGMLSGLQYWFESCAFVGAVIMIGWLGKTEEESQIYRAAHQIAINLASLTYMVALGISNAGAIRVGNALGRNDPENLRKAGFTTLFLTLAWMTATATAFVLGRDFFPTLYEIKHAEVLIVASRLMVIAAVFQWFDGAQVAALGILRGIQDVTVPTIVTFIAYWVAALPIAYFLGFYCELNIDGVWYSFVIGLGVAAVANMTRFWYLTKG